MERITFQHKVSKGTRFNQIYIPKEMQSKFEPGYLVEVTLIQEINQVYYSPTLTKVTKLDKLSKFKENLIKNIFLELKKYKEISQIFIIGSFLTQKQDFNDIDIILITDNINNNLEKQAYNNLIDKFELKFHIVSIPEDNFKNLQKYCPLTRSMFYYFVSNKEFHLSKETELNKDHIKFLLMMPEDILKINLNSKIYYDSIRRLITIEKFLKKQLIDPLQVNKELEDLISQEVFLSIKQNQSIEEQTIKKLRGIIKLKLDIIHKKLK